MRGCQLAAEVTSLADLPMLIAEKWVRRKLRCLAGSDEPPTSATAADITITSRHLTATDIGDREEKVSRAQCLRSESAQSVEIPLR